MLGFDDDCDKSPQRRALPFLDKKQKRRVDSRQMSLLFSNSAVRLLLALSVSIWMAGGCLLGCSNSVTASEAVDDSAVTVEAGESCHAVRSHDCCAISKPKQQKVRSAKQPTELPSFAPVPRGMMKDCPLVVNATAATSKNSTYVADQGRAPIAALPSLEKQTQLVNNALVVSFLPNRGPTHLRCCVFLI